LPTSETVDKVVRALRRGGDVQYFFETISSPDWITPLVARGFFKTPPPAIYEDQWVRYPGWPELDYLVRMAPLRPDLVSQVILAIQESDNARVRDGIVTAAIAMPAPESVAVAERVRGWVVNDQRFLDFDALAKLAGHLAQIGARDQALALSRALLAPLGKPSRGPGRLGSRASDWEYEQAVRLLASSLEGDKDGLSLFCDLLQSAIDATHRGGGPPSDGSLHLRPAIESHQQNQFHDEVLGVLVDATRDLALRYVELNPELLQDTVRMLETRPWRIFHRIALHLLRLRAPDAIAAVRERLLNRELMADLDLHHEYWLLARDAWPLLTDDEQVGLLEQLQEASGARTEDPGRTLAWEFQRLSILKDVATGPTLARYAALRDELGVDFDHPEFLSYMSSGWVGPTSPIDLDELRRMSADELIAYLSSWSPSGDWMSPSREGLSRDLQQLVAAEPGRFAEAMDGVRTLDPTYVRGIIEGWREAVRQEVGFDWQSVLELCNWVVERPQQLDSPSPVHEDRDPGWSWARRSVTDLLSAGLESGPCEIPLVYRAMVWASVQLLVDDSDPTVEHEAAYGGSNMDPPTLALNTVRGSAMHCLVRYALWLYRADESNRLAAEARGVLDAHLDVSREPSAAVRSIYGQWLPWMILMDEAWVTETLPRIFPDDPAEADLRSAAWNSYILFCRPFDRSLHVLYAAYLAAAVALEPAVRENGGGDRPDSRLVEHIAVFLLRGVIDTDDQLYLTYLAGSTPALREHFLAFVGRALAEDGDMDPRVVERAQALWADRLQAVRVGAGSDSKELEAFGWWLGSSKLDAGWRAAQIVTTLRLTGGRIDLGHSVLEELAVLAPTHPAQSVEAARLIVDADREGWEVVGSRDALRKIIESAIDSSSDESAEAARQLAHMLGAKGHRDFRDLVSGA